MENILEIEGLSKSFTLHHLGKRIQAVRRVNLRVREGEFVGITGKSGGGKSTGLRCIYRTCQPREGTILYRSRAYGPIDLAKASERKIIDLRKREIGYVSQFLNVMPRTTAKELVRQAMVEMGRNAESAEAEAERLLEHFELDPALWNSYPSTFSGGEKLRLNIARAMAKRPRLLLLDEPTASLDEASKKKVKVLIEKLMEEGATILGIFHDLKFMRSLCHREYVMRDGQLWPASTLLSGEE